MEPSAASTGRASGVAAEGPPTAEQLAGVLHEVSNALTVVLGWLESVTAEAAPAEVRAAIEVARCHARTGHRLARTAIGGSVAGPSELRSALAVARDTVLAVSREAARRQVDVHLAEEHAPDVFVAQASAATQILLNLLLNAIHFSPAGGAVTVGLTVAHGLLRVTVRDRGCGIAAPSVAKLFTAHASTRPGGSGLGLWYCHGLAARHGGSVELVATGEAGSTFALSWPISDVPSGFVQSASSASLRPGLRVLLLEDDPAVADLVELGLTGRGAVVRVASTLEQLMDALAAEPTDALLVDLSPLGPTAAESLRSVAARHPGAPMIIVSGSATASPPGVPVCGWVQKPFELAELVSALAALPAPP